MQPQASRLAQIELRMTGQPTRCVPLRRLRQYVELHVSTTKSHARSMVSDLPPLLHNIFYAPTESQKMEQTYTHIRVGMESTAYLLWPALQTPPAWMLELCELVPAAEVGVRWLYPFRERAYLNLCNLRKLYQERSLLIWRLRQSLKPGDEVVLPPGDSGNNPQGYMAIPWLSYILCLRPASNTAGDGPAILLNPSTACFHDRLLPCNTNALTCSLDQIYECLEEGDFNPEALTTLDADHLVNRVMRASDCELMLMLLDAGIGERCSHACLQSILQFAQQKGVPELAQLVLQLNHAELEVKVLNWLVRKMMAAGRQHDLEILLMTYCIERRNPLSSIAMMEEALLQVYKAGSTQASVNALAISLKFKAAKHFLLQQLVQQAERHQIATSSLKLEDSYARRGSQIFLSGSSTQMSVGELMGWCFNMKADRTIGSKYNSSRSIHDNSPYVAAVRISDAEFLSLAPVIDYTQRLWQGMELPTISALCARRSEREAIACLQQSGPFSAHSGQAAITAAKARAGIPTQPDAQYAAAGAEAVASKSPAGLQEQSSPEARACSAAGDYGCQLTCMDQTRLIDGEVIVSTSHLSTQPHLSAASPSKQLQGRDEGKNRFEGSQSDTRSLQSMAAKKSTKRWDRSHGDTQHDKQQGSGNTPDIADGCRRWLSRSVGLELLQSMGLAGPGTQPLAVLASRAAHAALLAPRALHNSARGRWMMQCFFQVIFLVCHQMWIAGALSQPTLMVFLPALVAGNLVDAAFQLRYIFKGSVGAFLADHYVKLDLIVNFGLLAMLFWEDTHLPHKTFDEFRHGKDDIMKLTGISALMSVFAVLVWIRALGILTPISARLGAMVCTLRRAAEEAAVMVPMVIALILGFSTSLMVVYKHAAMPEYSTVTGAMRMLVGVTGGSIDMLWFDHAADGDAFLAVWGQILMTSYVVVVNILIMTMLIAVINYSYHPDQVRDETTMKQAQTVLYYDTQQRLGIAGAPFNILQLMLLWLPQGYRQRVNPTQCIKFGIPPLDGLVPANSVASPQLFLPTGPAEVSYLAFLLTLYPLLCVVAVAAMLLHTPFAVLHFALWGHHVWTGSSWGPGSKDAASNAHMVNAPSTRATADAVAVRPSFQGCRTQSWSTAGLVWEAAAQLQAAAQAGTRTPCNGTFTRQHRAGRLSVLVTTEEAPIVHSISSQLSAASPHTVATGLVPVKEEPSCCSWLRRPLAHMLWVVATIADKLKIARCCTVLLAAVVGTVAHLVLVLVLTVALLWAWCTRILFSVYCVFAASTSDVSCCPQRACAANFWDKVVVEAAFYKTQRSATTSRSSGGGSSAYDWKSHDLELAKGSTGGTSSRFSGLAGIRSIKTPPSGLMMQFSAESATTTTSDATTSTTGNVDHDDVVPVTSAAGALRQGPVGRLSLGSQ